MGLTLAMQEKAGVTVEPTQFTGGTFAFALFHGGFTHITRDWIDPLIQG